MHHSPGTGPNLEAAVRGRNVDNAACGHSEANFVFVSECVYHTDLQMVNLVVCSQLGNFSLPSSNTGDYWGFIPCTSCFWTPPCGRGIPCIPHSLCLFLTVA